MIKTYDKDIISDSQEWGVNKRDKGRFLKGDEVYVFACKFRASGHVRQK